MHWGLQNSQLHMHYFSICSCIYSAFQLMSSYCSSFCILAYTYLFMEPCIQLRILTYITFIYDFEPLEVLTNKQCLLFQLHFGIYIHICGLYIFSQGTQLYYHSFHISLFPLHSGVYGVLQETSPREWPFKEHITFRCQVLGGIYFA